MFFGGEVDRAKGYAQSTDRFFDRKQTDGRWRFGVVSVVGSAGMSMPGELQDPDAEAVFGNQQVVVHLRDAKRAARCGVEMDPTRCGVRGGQVRDDQFVPRMMMPLSLSYDHRLIDGADGTRFLRWIVEAIEQPLLISLEG